MATLHLRGDAASILSYLARERWGAPPPAAVVSVRERTPREYLASRRLRWVVAALLLAVIVASLGMLASDASDAASASEAELLASWLAIFAFTLLSAAITWRIYRAAKLLEIGPLDAAPRSFRVEPAALVIAAPEGGERRLELAALTRCEVVGHPTKHGWHLEVLTLDDGAGAIELRTAWLPSEQILIALAERLLRTGAVVAARGDG